MGFRITLGGQDITAYVQEMSIQAKDNMGQAPGMGGGGSTPRAATAQFLTSLGPMSSALGAGQPLPPITTNLYPNNTATGSAVDGPNTNTGSGVAVSVDGSNSWEGTSSYKINTSGGGTFQQIEFHIPAASYTPGATYTMSLYAKGSGTLRIYMQASTGSIGTVSSHTLSSIWTRYTVTVTMPNPITATWIGIRLDTGSTAQAVTYWVDGLQIEQYGSATPFHTGTTTPSLQRQSEVILYDANNNKIFGGYTGKLSDKTDKLQNYTQVECYDYYQELDRIQVQQVYSGVSDIYMIRDLLTKYAPWVDQSALPQSGTYTFAVKNFKAITLQKVLNAICDVTGYSIWIDPYRKIHYVYPMTGSTAPFTLSSAPDFVHSFQLGVDEYDIDDTAAINRVTFYGGKQPSNAFTQDLSTQANGSNLLFVLAYYPRSLANGTFTIVAQNINSGSPLTYGYLLGRGAQNQFISQGGLAAVLINADAHTLHFDPGGPAPTNNGPGSVTASYRYEYPMNIQLTDQASFQFFGKYYDGVISDDTVFDQATAVGRCRTLLTEQSRGLTTLKVKCWRPGIQAGMVLSVYHGPRNISGSFVVQEVDIVPKGAGNFEYQITCGAWRWNMVDILLSAASAAFAAGINTNDNENGIQENAVNIEQMVENVKSTSETWTTQVRQWGQYYARTAALNDGHDAYAGLFSISS